MEDLYLEYLEDLRRVADADDDYFPDFLFNFLSNDFGDNYYQRGIAETPLLADAKKIRRKYSDFFDYIDAMEIYDQYMDMLAEKYGSKKIVKHSAKEGYLEEYVPPKPRLKNTRKNRQLAANGIIPSRRVVDMPTPETLNDIAREAMPNENGEILTYEDFNKKMPKKYKKLFDDAYAKAASNERRKNMYRAISGTNAEIDFIINFINNANDGRYSSTYSSQSTDDRPISEILVENETENDIPPELLDSYLAPNTKILRNSRLVGREEEEQVEVLTKLYEMGVDVFNSYGKNMSKTSVKMIRSAVGGGPLTKKEKKKAKKLAKKEEKRMANRRNNDALLERTLLGNRFKFDANGNTMSLRLSDLVK